MASSKVKPTVESLTAYNNKFIDTDFVKREVSRDVYSGNNNTFKMFCAFTNEFKRKNT
jgi:hypothetical protein